MISSKSRVLVYVGQYLHNVIRGSFWSWDSEETIHVTEGLRTQVSAGLAKHSLSWRKVGAEKRIRAYDSTVYHRCPKVAVLYANLMPVRRRGGEREGSSTEERKGLYSSFRRIINSHIVERVVLELPEVGSEGDEGWTTAEAIAFLSESGYAVWWQVLEPSAIDRSRGRKRMVVFATLRAFGIIPFAVEEVLSSPRPPLPKTHKAEDQFHVRQLGHLARVGGQQATNGHQRKVILKENLGTQAGEGYYASVFSIARMLGNKDQGDQDYRYNHRVKYINSIRNNLLLEQ